MMKKLVVMRDFATCFTACTRLDEEQATNSSTSTDRSSKAIAYTSKGQRRVKQERGNKETITETDRYQERSSKDTPQPSTFGEVDTVAKSLDSSFPSFKEEDFLDFCFRQDGGIEMVKEKTNSRVSDHSISSRRSNSNHKIKHGGNGQRSNKDTETKGETNPLALHKLIDEQQDTNNGEEWLPDEIKEVDQVESAESKTVSGESSDSYHSDTSSSSFAFPVLSWERMGSPVQMPKTERISSHRRRHKHRSVPRHCCRF